MATPIHHTLHQLTQLDVSEMDRTGLTHAAALITTARAWLDALDIDIARRLHTITGHAPDTAAGTDDTATTLATGGRRSQRTTRKTGGRAAICDRLPAFDTALRSGAVAGEHLDAIANATRELHPHDRTRLDHVQDQLLDAATTQTPETFARTARRIIGNLTDPDQREHDTRARLERQRRRSKLTSWVDDTTGMNKFLLELDPENAAKITTALDTKLAELLTRPDNTDTPIGRLRATALVELVTNQPDGHKRIPEVYVHIDYHTLTTGLHEHSLCELNDGTPIPAETARRLCCDANIIPVVLDGPSQPLDLGRSRRTANHHQRRALRALHRTCAHPECATPFEHCDIHHIHFWEHHGPTDIDNLIPLCHRHHHLVHEGRWQLHMTPDRTITLTRPDGTTHHHGPTTDRPPPARPPTSQPPTPHQSRTAGQPRTPAEPRGAGEPRPPDQPPPPGRRAA